MDGRHIARIMAKDRLVSVAALTGPGGKHMGTMKCTDKEAHAADICKVFSWVAAVLPVLR